MHEEVILAWIKYIIVCMFIGQLGVSTSLLAWFKKIPTTQEIKYSTEDIKIG